MALKEVKERCRRIYIAAIDKACVTLSERHSIECCQAANDARQDSSTQPAKDRGYKHDRSDDEQRPGRRRPRQHIDANCCAALQDVNRCESENECCTDNCTNKPAIPCIESLLKNRKP